MIYFFLADICKMHEVQVKYKLTEWLIVSYSPAAWQIRHGQYLNWYSDICPGHTEKLAGLEVKRVSWLSYVKWRVKCLLAWLYGYGFYAQP